MAYKVNTIFTVTYNALKQGISGIKSQFKSVEKSAESAKTKLSNAFKTANEDIKNTSKAIKEQSELINNLTKISAVGVATITLPTILAGKAALTMAGEYEAATQTLAYTLGEAKSIVDDFVSNNAQSLGMAEQDAYKFANIYSNLLTTVTEDQKTNATYTNKLMQASAVIMSKTGRTFEDVADRIRSGLLGNTEAIEDLGVNVNVALLETTDAFEQIADGRSWESLSFQEQQQVRILGILEQTTKKYGEEVGDNLSLKLAQTSAKFADIKSEASQFFAVGLQPLISGINNIMNNILIFVKYLNSLDDSTKKTITTFVIVVAAIPVVALEFSMLIKTINSYIIFTKIASASTVTLTKSMIGLVSGVLLLVAGIAMLTYGLGLWGKTSKKTTDNTSSASKAINSLTSTQEKNAKSAEKASEANKKLSDNLQSFDEINKLNLDTSSDVDSDIDTIGLDLSQIDTTAFDNIDTNIGDITDKVEEFKEQAEELKPVLSVLGGIITVAGLTTIGSKIVGIAKGLGLIKTGATVAGTASVTAGAGIAGVIASIKSGFETVAIAGMYGKDAIVGAMTSMGTFGSVLGGVTIALPAIIWGITEMNKPIADLSVETQLFDKNISNATKNAVEPFMSSLQNLGTTIWGLELGKIVTAEDVENVKTQTAELSNTLKTGISDKYAELQEQINNVNLFPDATKREEYLSILETSMNNEQAMVQFYEDKINEIVANAASQNRSLTDVERVEIENIRKQMGETGISTLSANQEEALAIKAKFNENFYNLEVEQVADAIKQAKELKDKTIEEAQAQYDEKIALAEKMKETVPGFSQEMYEKMTQDSKTELDQQLLDATETYDDLIKTAQEKYPEVTKTIDTETGEIKNRWQIAGEWCEEKAEDIGNAFSTVWSNAKEGAETKFDEIKKNFEDFKTKINDKITKIKEKWQTFKDSFSFPNIKTPHFTWSSTPATGWMKTVLEALSIPASIPKLSVSWYKSGGVFGSDSIIGVGEYVGAKSNPEIVAPQSMIYDASIEAIQDSRQSASSISTGSDSITKKIKLELDLTQGGVKLGKQIVDLVLDANDFYDLGLF